MKVKEAKELIQYEIAPTLGRSISGNFRVRVNGVEPRSHFVELELLLVDENGAELYSFGKKMCPPGQSVTLKGLTSQINFRESPIKQAILKSARG